MEILSRFVAVATIGVWFIGMFCIGNFVYWGWKSDNDIINDRVGMNEEIRRKLRKRNEATAWWVLVIVGMIWSVVVGLIWTAVKWVIWG